MNRRRLDIETPLPATVWSQRKWRRLTADLVQKLHRSAAHAGPLVAAADGPGLLDWAARFLPHYFRSPPSAMHRRLAEWCAVGEVRRGLKLNVVGPRGGAKSTVATLAWVLRAAIEAREPYVWIVSDTESQAELHLQNIKTELVDNRAIRRAYPLEAGRGPIWRRRTIRLNNGVVCEALSTGQRIRGRRSRQHRPTLIVCDDLQNDGHIVSAAQRESSNRWFHGTLLKAGDKRTNIIHLATALHRDALAMTLDRTPGWTSRIFPAIVHWPDDLSLWDRWEAIYYDREHADSREAARRFYDEHRAAMDAGAELLWPEEESLYALMCMRVESGRSAFEREKQGAPVNPDLCEWPESYFADAALWFDAWPTRPVVKTMALDPSKGRDAGRGDYSALAMVAIDDGGVIYCEADLARRPTPEMVHDAFERHRIFGPQAFGIETNHFQELLGDELVREFRRRGLSDFAPWTIDNRVAKQVRIRRLGPLLAQRRLRFRANSPGTRLLVDQLRDFPHADHDDGPDALEMAIRLANELQGAQE